MYRIILTKIAAGLLTTLGVSSVIFLGTNALPGDAAQIRLGQAATEDSLRALREELGLNLPLYQQYFRWLFNFLQGEFGTSLASGNVTIAQLISDRYENTLIVSTLTAMIGVPISVGLGIMAAMFPGTIYDRFLTLGSVTLVAAPEFFTATLMVLFVVFFLGIGNAVVVGSIEDKNLAELITHFILPIATLCLVIAAQLIRMTRAAVLNVMNSPYIEMAILKGIPRRRVVMRHALLNAIGPIVNVIAINLAYVVTGVIVIEVYFGYAGLATLIVQGVQTRDYILIQTLGMIFCATYVILMMIADLASILSNPRLRHPK